MLSSGRCQAAGWTQQKKPTVAQSAFLLCSARQVKEGLDALKEKLKYPSGFNLQQ
jgi:hypothetical protein